MKKSEMYKMAALCVMDSAYDAEDRLEVLAMLLDNLSTAVWIEEEGKKQMEKEVQA